jgi:hypothetical protein
LKMNELRSKSTGIASSTTSSTLPLTLLLVRCDQLVRAPHSHATTVHSNCKITVQFSHGFFPLNHVIAKTRKVRSRMTRNACIVTYKMLLKDTKYVSLMHGIYMTLITHLYTHTHTHTHISMFHPSTEISEMQIRVRNQFAGMPVSSSITFLTI